MNTLQPECSELLRRVSITCKARYHAASRMAAHGWFSQWTLALLAVGQIVISLVGALDLRSNFSPSYLSFGSIFFGVLVLAYSLLLGMSNFSARAVKLHENGLELGRLARNLYVLQSDSATPTKEEYDSLSKEYYDILDKYENHTRTDYLLAHFEYYSGIKSDHDQFSKKWWLYKAPLYGIRVKTYLFKALQFFHYIGSIFLIYIWLYFLVRSVAC
jgi:hypothetical protein